MRGHGTATSITVTNSQTIGAAIHVLSAAGGANEFAITAGTITASAFTFTLDMAQASPRV